MFIVYQILINSPQKRRYHGKRKVYNHLSNEKGENTGPTKLVVIKYTDDDQTVEKHGNYT